MGKYFALIPKYFKDPEQNARWAHIKNYDYWDLPASSIWLILDFQIFSFFFVAF